MRRIKRSLCILLSALMVVTSLDLSGVTLLKADASEIAQEMDYYEDYETDVSTNDSINNGELAEEEVSGDADVDGDGLSDGLEGEPESENIDAVGGYEASVTELVESGFIDVSEGLVQEGGYLPTPKVRQPSTVIEENGEGYVEIPQYEATAANITKTKNAIYNAFLNLNTSVDISAYSIKTTEIYKIFLDVVNEHSELFYVYRGYSYSYNPSTGIVVSLTLGYEHSASDIVIMREEFNDAVDEFLAGVDSEWSDLEKMIYINSYLSKNCMYDTNYMNDALANPNRYNAYGCLVDKVCVCQGYALAVNYLCRLIGVESCLLTSTNLCHAWNLVKVNGKVYHIDVTWDDAMPDKAGSAYHDYFLKSNTLFNLDEYDGGHVSGTNDWVVQSGWNWNDATSTKYDEGNVWDNCNYGIEYYGNHEWFYTLYYPTGIYKAQYDSTTQTLKQKTKKSDSNLLSFSGIGIYDGKIYFNGTKYAYCYDPVAGTTSTVFSLATEAPSSNYMNGLCVIQNQLKYSYTKTGDSSTYYVGTYQLSNKKYVYYNGNGATLGTMAKEEITGPLTIDENQYSRPGYAFVGWNTKADGSGTSYAAGDSVNPSGNLYLYAQWVEKTSYSVTFNGNGGAPTTASSTYAVGEAFGTLPSVSRAGYTFKGWFTAKTGGSQIIASTIMSFSQATTVYAQWEANSYTVNFDKNCEDSECTVSQASADFVYDAQFTSLPEASRPGYTFKGWFTAATGGTKVIATTVMKYDTTTTLYAQWTAKSVTVTFDGNGNGDTTKLSFATKAYTFDAAYASLPTATRTGYTFDGWFTEAEGGTRIETTSVVKFAEGGKLYAHWSAAEFVVNFKKNCTDSGVVLEYESRNFTYGEALGTLPTATRPGYTFKGWYTAATGGTLADETAVMKTAAAVTYYARWEATTQTVNFVVNGGVGVYNLTYNSEDYTYDKAFGKLPVACSNSAAFLGWFTAPSGGEEIKTTTIMKFTETTTLYGRWDLRGDAPVNGTYGNIGYYVKNGAAIVNSIADSATGTITIPEKLGGYPVIAIEGATLYDTTNVTAISIPASVGYIDDMAFNIFDGKLASITVNASNPFYMSKDGALLTKDQTRLIYMPIAKTGSYSIPSTVTDIGKAAFVGSRLSSVNIPASVSSIGIIAFRGAACSITVDEGNTNYASIEGSLLNKDCSILYNAYTTGKDTYVFPDSVKTLDDYAFWTSPIKNIVIPTSVKTIGMCTFFGCEDLTDIYFMHTKDDELSVGGVAFYSLGTIDTVVCVPDATDIHPAITSTSWDSRNVRYESDFYPVTYHLDGGENNENNPVSYRRSDDRILYAPSKFGYEFKGWFKEADFSGDAITIIPIGVNDVYAKFEAIGFTITLDTQGGELDVESVIVKFGEAFGELPIPARENYDFLGWYDGTDAGANLIYDGITPSAIIKDTAVDQTFYARWETKYQCATPVFSIDGEVVAGQSVTIDCPTNDVLIYISTDGNDPVIAEENLYSGEIIITEPVTIKAIAVKEGYRNSEIETAFYTIRDDSDDWKDLGTNPDDLDFIKNQVLIHRGDLSDISEVKATDIPNELWVYGVEDYDYTGKAVTQVDAFGNKTMRVYWGTTLLVENVDYTVKYTNNVKAGTATITITGKGNYSGAIVQDFKVNALNLGSSDAHCADIKLAFNNKVQKGVPVVTYDISEVINGETVTKTVTLKNGTDYTIEYPCTNVKDKENYDANAFKAANTSEYYPDGYEIKITGKGNYTGTLVIHEFIYADTVNVSSLGITLKSTSYNDGAECVPGTGSVIKKGKVVLEATDFVVAADAVDAQAKLDAADADTTYSIIVYYENNVEIGTAKATYVGIPAKGYAGSVTKTFAITGSKLTAVSYAPELVKTYSWELDSETNTGKKIEPVNALGDDNASLYVMKNKVRVANLSGIEAGEYARILSAGTAEEKATLRTYDYTYKYVGDTQNVGSVTIEFTGINGYTGTVKKTYKITGKSIAKFGVRGINATYTYSGKAIKPGNDGTLGEVEVFIPATKTAPEQVLVAGRDYVIDETTGYKNNVNAGTATVEIKGINGYTGVIKKSFKITPYSITGDAITIVGDVYDGNTLGEFTYTKGGVKPVVKLDFNKDGVEALLMNGKDYTLSYSNNGAVNDGTNARKVPTLKVTGKGNYSGTLTFTFTIAKADLADPMYPKTVTASEVVASKKAGAVNPVITVVEESGGAKLAAGVDYVAPTVANGSVYYAKDCVVTQVVSKKTVSKVRKEGDKVDKADIVPAGAELKAVIKAVDKATCNYYGEIETTYRVSTANINSAVVTIKPQTYMGKDGDNDKAVLLSKSDITVKVGKTVLNKTDYEIVGYKNNYKKGTAQVTLRGVGNYGGTKVASFTITAKNMNYTVVYDNNNLYMATHYPYVKDATGAMKDSVIGAKGKLAKVAFKRANYTFVGWNTKSDGTGASYTNAEAFKVKEGMTLYGTTIRLYAQWAPVNFKVTYGLGGGTNDASNVVSYNIDDEEIVINAPTREGATFAGWYLDARCTKKAPVNDEGKTVIAAHSFGNKAFYAKWIIHKYTVVFDKNADDATGVMANLANKPYGTAFRLTANKYVRAGYTFAGWNTKADGSGTSYTNAASVKNLTVEDGEVVTLYAQWNVK